MTDVLAATNQGQWNRTAAVRNHRAGRHLLPSELALLSRVGSLSNMSFLDIAVGTGRTTFELLPQVRRYVGIDYSASMIDEARRQFTGVDMRCMDARNLSAFADGEFDFVLFSFNGIDYVEHPDRLKILAEVRRVLKPGGVFAVSSHNRGFSTPSPFAPHHLSLSGSPADIVIRWARFPLGVYNSFRMRPKQVFKEEYELRNDEYLHYAMLAYFILPYHQVRQLKAAGFEVEAVFDLNGTEIDASSPDKTYPYSYMAYYLARKPA